MPKQFQSHSTPTVRVCKSHPQTEGLVESTKRTTVCSLNNPHGHLSQHVLHSSSVVPEGTPMDLSHLLALDDEEGHVDAAEGGMDLATGEVDVDMLPEESNKRVVKGIPRKLKKRYV